MAAIIVGGILLVVGVVLILVARSRGKLKAQMDAMETVPVAELREATHAELKGVAACDAPITPPECEVGCVHYSYEIERRERRKTSSGSTSYTWRTVDSGRAEVPFTLTDPGGSVVIDPEGADFDAPVLIQRELPPGRRMEGGVLKAVVGAVGALSGQRERIVVRGVTPGQELYVLGDVMRGADGALRVAKGDNRFFISTKSEEQLKGRLGLQAFWLALAGWALGIAGLVALIIGLVK